MKKMLLFIALMACAATSGAKDIEGAFGFKFGERFDPTRTDYTLGPITHYQFYMSIVITRTDKNLYPVFDKYVVSVARETGEIFAVFAMRHNAPNCLELKEQYATAIANKYNISMTKSLPTSPGLISNDLTYSDNNYTIVVSCNYTHIGKGESEYPDLNIYYQDTKLLNKAIMMSSQTELNIDKSLL